MELPKKKKPSEASTVDDGPDRAGGYGESHMTKTYETNVANPFKDVRYVGMDGCSTTLTMPSVGVA